MKHANKVHLSEDEARSRADALNPHLRRQGRELFATRKDNNWFLVLKRLPPNGSAEGAVENIAPPITKMEVQHGITPGPEPYSLSDYFAFGSRGKENRKRPPASPYTPAPIGEKRARKARR